MSKWMDEPEGTAQVVFEDGSALVRATVEPAIIEACLMSLGVESDVATDLARILADQGLMFAGSDYPYRVVEGKTMSGASFNGLAEYLGSQN